MNVRSRDPVGIDLADPCRLAPAILQRKKEFPTPKVYFRDLKLFFLRDPVGIQNTKYLEIVLKWFVLKISILQS